MRKVQGASQGPVGRVEPDSPAGPFLVSVDGLAVFMWLKIVTLCQKIKTSRDKEFIIKVRENYWQLKNMRK